MNRYLILIYLLIAIVSCNETLEYNKDYINSQVEWLVPFVQEYNVANGHHYIDAGKIEFDIENIYNKNEYFSCIDSVAQKMNWKKVGVTSSNVIKLVKPVNVYGDIYENQTITITYDEGFNVAHYVVE